MTMLDRSLWWGRMLAAVGIALALAIDPTVPLVVAFVFVAVVPFEKLFPRHRDQPVRRPLVGLDVRYALVSPVLNVIGLAAAVVVAIVSLAWLPGLALRPLVALLPGWANLVLATLLFDAMGYWAHRWMHEVPQLWRIHAIHHSTEHLDWVSGFRVHPLDGIVIAPPVALLLAAGIDPTVVGALAVLQVVVGLFLHANVRWRLRPVQRLIATPEFHHWHHANEIDAHCSNYGALFPIWDQLFGTWFMPRNIRPQRYGVDHHVPSTMRGQLREPLGQLPPLTSVARHPWRAVRQGARGTRVIATGVWRSTTRERRPKLTPGTPWSWTTHPPNTTAGRGDLRRSWSGPKTHTSEREIN